ncbi:MAG: CARDB domain-containing protein [Phototrophicaceae bacterium]
MKFNTMIAQSIFVLRSALGRMATYSLLLCMILLVHSPIAWGQSLPSFKIAIFDDTPDGSLLNGALLAINEYNQAGGVRGADGTAYLLESLPYTVTDDASFTDGLRQIIDNNVILAIGPTRTDLITQNLPQIRSTAVPFFIVSDDELLILSDGSKSLFRIHPSESTIANAMTQFLVKRQAHDVIAVVQLDESTIAQSLAMTNALSAVGLPPIALIATDNNLMADAIAQIDAFDMDAVVLYGEPSIAATFYLMLRAAGFAGDVVYPSLQAEDFQLAIPLDQRANLYGTTPWSITTADATSATFLTQYVMMSGSIPNSYAAGGYDAIQIMNHAIHQPGEFKQNLLTVTNVNGVQGILATEGHAERELSSNVMIIAHDQNGLEQVIARYTANTEVPVNDPQAIIQPVATAMPEASPTPQGVVATILSETQNIRSGPGTEYDILGELVQDEQVEIVGTNSSNGWLVIRYRGVFGWIANLPELNSVFGNVRTLPIIAAPPLPTPVVTQTPTPSPNADIVIQSASVSPNPIQMNSTFTLAVTVANIGLSNAGTFAIAATFPPNNAYASATINSLAAGQITTVNLSGSLNAGGTYTVTVIADLNNQVAEGTGESNNSSYTYTYTVDNTYRAIGTGLTMATNDTRDIDSGSVDLKWTGTKLERQNNATLKNMGSISYSGVTKDSINPSSTTNIDETVSVGQVIYIITNEGYRGAIEVTSINNGNITFNYKIFN